MSILINFDYTIQIIEIIPLYVRIINSQKFNYPNVLNNMKRVPTIEKENCFKLQMCLWIILRDEWNGIDSKSYERTNSPHGGYINEKRSNYY